jgi:hypothetical protein
VKGPILQISGCIFLKYYTPTKHYRPDGYSAVGDIKHRPNAKIQEIYYVAKTQAVDKIPYRSG